MKQPILSFIIPIYKIEDQYLIRCVLSLNTQTFKKDFECLFIIDEPNNLNYQKIIKKYLDPKISYKVIYNLTNIGLGPTRNVGIHKSYGQYVAFIDSDDYLRSNYVSEVISLLKNKKIDFLKINYTSSKIDSANNSKSQILYCTDFTQFKNQAWASWLFIINKKFLSDNKIAFLNKKCFAEDYYFFCIVISLFTKAIELDLKLYFYDTTRNNSIMNQLSSVAKIFKMVQICFLAMKQLHKRHKKYFKLFVYTWSYIFNKKRKKL